MVVFSFSLILLIISLSPLSPSSLFVPLAFGKCNKNKNEETQKKQAKKILLLCFLKVKKSKSVFGNLCGSFLFCLTNIMFAWFWSGSSRSHVFHNCEQRRLSVRHSFTHFSFFLPFLSSLLVLLSVCLWVQHVIVDDTPLFPLLCSPPSLSLLSLSLLPSLSHIRSSWSLKGFIIAFGTIGSDDAACVLVLAVFALLFVVELCLLWLFFQEERGKEEKAGVVRQYHRGTCVKQNQCVVTCVCVWCVGCVH